MLRSRKQLFVTKDIWNTGKKVQNTYEIYKPLRNYLRHFEIEESLVFCWQSANYLSFSIDNLDGIELPKSFTMNKSPMNFGQNVIHLHEIDFLISEICLNAEQKLIKKKMFSVMKDRSKVVNYIRYMTDCLYQHQGEERILIEMNRIMHQQFGYQTRSRTDYLYRHYRIYSYGSIPQMIHSYYSLAIHELFYLGLAFLAYFMKRPCWKEPFKIEIPEITEESVKKYLSVFSQDIDKMQEEINVNRRYDETLIYQYNIMRIHPIIKIGPLYYCPMPVNLFYQLVKGIYYNLINEAGFSEQLGASFAEYIEFITKKMNINGSIKVIRDQKYGKEHKRTSDIIIYDDNSIVFIECKSKRMRQSSKENIKDLSSLQYDIHIIAEAVVQLGKTINDYKNNLYQTLVYDSQIAIYSVVLTLEDWYLQFNHGLMSLLDEDVKIIAMEKKAQPPTTYSILSVEDYEYMIQIICKHGISYYFETATDKQWGKFSSVPREEMFSKEVRELFRPPDIMYD